MLFGPFDPLLAVLYAALKLRRVRYLVLLVGLLPASIYALPAQPCSCLLVPFRRCSISGRELAYIAAMKSDLKNLASQQEIYFADHGTFTADVEALAFQHSHGVQVTIFASGDGWSAQATHVVLAGTDACAVYAGEPPVPIEQLHGADQGELVCTR